MGYIKSNSKYVAQKKHQNINNGVIFERDFSTIGGIGDYVNNEQKYYKNGTFVFQINDNITRPSHYITQTWEKNNGEEYWVGNQLNLSPQQESWEIILKQDIYKLKDFAYYGSCAELVRSSINDIIQRFPGELHSPKDGIIAMDENDKNLGIGDVKYLLDNPFNLNLHTSDLTDEEKNDISFVQGDFSANYDVFIGTRKWSNCKITLIPKTEYEASLGDNKTLINRFKISKGGTGLVNIIIDCHRTNSCDIVYLTNIEDFSIRPKEQYYKSFMNSLDEFQKLLLNEYSTPKYSVIFEVMNETEYGYQIKYEKFNFPKGLGGYNLGITTEEFGIYISQLSKYADFFDNLYCHNLYRSLTHESIKNFDWTNVLQRGEETKEDYIDGGNKIQKMLNICGRELDEIKFYIDGIKNANNITYNDACNIPDYFLTDTLDVEGWDIINVFPYSGDNVCLNEIVYPYSNKNKNVIDYPDGYFAGFTSATECKITKQTIDGNFWVDSRNYLRNKIKQYINEKPYTMHEMNNKIMKMLKLNSRAILQHKGTIEGIEMLLSLFGLKSKRWCDSFTSWGERDKRFNGNYDYKIEEHIALTDAIKDENKQIDTYNQSKTIVYNTVEYQNNIYEPYQGLPVRYYEIGNDIYLCPYFSYDKIIDGSPYYQMNGGWALNEGCYADTNTQIPFVNTIMDLLNIPISHLYDGIIYQVQNLNGKWINIGDSLYEIKYYGENEYISFIVNNHSIIIDDEIWDGEITISNINSGLSTINLEDYRNGQEIKIFVQYDENEAMIHISKENGAITNYCILRDLQNNEKTKYFQLYTVENRYNFSMWGWNQLTTDSSSYKTINNIKRNFNANNPHKNGLKYDEGFEYIEYFAQLFKYALENEEFNSKFYTSFNAYMEALSSISNIGFPNLINESSDNECEKSIKTYPSFKINYFGDYLSGNTQFHFNEFQQNESNEYNIWDVETSRSDITNEKRQIGFIDQIINLKNVTITFNLRTNMGNDMKTYINSIIMHYLLQIIPPNTILKIKYE